MATIKLYWNTWKKQKTKLEISEFGTKRWFNDKGQLHSKNGPAVIYSDGLQYWYVNDQRYYDNKSFQRAAKLTDEDMNMIVLKYGNVK